MAPGGEPSGHHTDPTFYRSPRDAARAPAEKLAYVATFARPADKPDAMAVVDLDPDSASYSQVVGFTELPNVGDELHSRGSAGAGAGLACGTDRQLGEAGEGNAETLHSVAMRVHRQQLPARAEDE